MCVLVVRVEPVDPPEDAQGLLGHQLLLQDAGLAVQRLLVVGLRKERAVELNQSDSILSFITSTLRTCLSDAIAESHAPAFI